MTNYAYINVYLLYFVHSLGKNAVNFFSTVLLDLAVRAQKINIRFVFLILLYFLVDKLIKFLYAIKWKTIASENIDEFRKNQLQAAKLESFKVEPPAKHACFKYLVLIQVRAGVHLVY